MSEDEVRDEGEVRDEDGVKDEDDVEVKSEDVSEEPLFTLLVGSKKFYVDFYEGEGNVDGFGLRKITACSIAWKENHRMLEEWGETMKHPLEPDNPSEGFRYSFKHAVANVAKTLGYNAKKTREFSSQMRNALWKARIDLIESFKA